jgi:hypothetical protein
MAHSCGSRSHLRDHSPELVDLVPIRELDNRVRVRRTLCHPHDEADHLLIHKTQARIVDLARKYRKSLRFPVYLLQELLQIGVGFRLVFLGLPRDDIDGKKGVRMTLENRLVLLYELMDKPLSPFISIVCVMRRHISTVWPSVVE